MKITKKKNAKKNTHRQKRAHNLHDSQIIELIKNNVISLQDGMEMAPADKMLYRTPGIYKLLLGKIFTPQYASQLTPMMRRLLNTEPYTTFITNKPEFIGILQDWSETDLQRLFARTIIGLFNNNLLSLEHLRHPTPNFFPILYGNNIYQLLIKRNISLTQALNLTSATWSTIESHRFSKLIQTCHRQVWR